jgi:cullin 3
MIGGRPKQRIRAPRRLPHPGNSETFSFDQTWSELEPCFRQIHEKEASELSYEELFRKAYAVVLKKSAEDYYDKLLEFERIWLSRTVQSRVLEKLSPELTLAAYGGLSTATFSPTDRRIAGESLLNALRAEWSDQILCLNMISDVSLYLERTWCTENRKPPIFTAGIQLFRDHVLKAATPTIHGQETTQLHTVLAVVVNTMLDQIQMERDGDIVDKSMLKGCTQMLEGMYLLRIETEDQKLYRQCFEPQFLEASRQFYSQESERLLQELNAGLYCRETKRRLMEEQERCISSLSISTKPEIDKVVAHEMITNKLKDLIHMDSGVISMIDNDRIDELALIYELSCKVDLENKELIAAIHERIMHAGESINKSALNPLEEVSAANQQTVAALKWVEEVLAVKDKFDKIVERAFSADQILHTAQTKSFTSFINSSNFGRASEYLSLFIDDNMKKGIKDKSEAEVDLLLQKSIQLLKYVADKDMFERYYKKHLSRRLLLSKSQSLDVEKQMIGKMKVELGNTFTAKMEVMFKDMTLSADLTQSFKSVMAGLNLTDQPKARPTDLSINVLTSMTWPQELVKDALEKDSTYNRVIYPKTASKIMDKFNMFYSTKHNGRRLTWMPNMGSVDIRARFPATAKDPKDRVYELNVSTYAMIVLELFNLLLPGDYLTAQDIQATTNIPQNDLYRNLQSLSLPPKTRILKKDPMVKEVNPDDKFYFNDAYKSQFLRVKVGVVALANRVETERERLNTERTNDDSRKLICEAAIVRIMKYVFSAYFNTKLLNQQQATSRT